MSKPYKSGFVAIIGRPNVGKSTLLNQLVGQKVAIMSDKPQTTRNKILGVITREDAQIIFLDTPGIHKPQHKLGEYMVRVAQSTLSEVDVILFVVEAQELPGPGDKYIIERLKTVSTPVILVVNKIDLVAKPKLLPLIETYQSLYNFTAMVPVAAINQENTGALVEEIIRYLPEGPQYYPEDMLTDQPERLIVAEMIREKVLHLTRQEIPHSVAVEVEEMLTRPNGLVYVNAVIYVERDSQKGIIIGKGGRMLQEIGKLARADIENLLGSPIYLELWVKVKKDWRNQETVLRSLGYEIKER